MNWRALLLVFLCAAAPALAIDSGEPFEDPVLQARYDNLINQLRCMVCMNQSIADSNAELAENLRAQVRELLEQGRSDEEIIAYMTERYGDFVLYKPPVQANTWLLWGGPFLLLAGAFLALAVALRRRARLPDADREDDEATP